MKKKLERHKLLLIITSLIVIKLGIYYYGDVKDFIGVKTYNHYVNKFEKITPTDAVNLANTNKSELLIYFGRNTCPHCVKSIKNVYNMSNKSIEKDIPFYYIEDESELSEKDNDLINNVFQLKYVPSIFKISDKNIEVFDYEEIENKEYEKDFSKFLNSSK